MWKIVLAFVLLTASAIAAWSFLLKPTPKPNSDDTTKPANAEVAFTDVTAKSGIAFRAFDAATTEHLIPETMGHGLAWIDYDADGWPDLFCVQCGPLPPATDTRHTHKLYRNNRDGTFADVTDAVGLNHSGFGVGCTVGDYDNDGYDDLLVTYLGKTTLFHNEANTSTPGGRKFVDVTANAGIVNTQYGTSCAWGDLDNDGFLDLYICNYVVVDPAKPVTCFNEEKKLYYQCSPTAFSYTSHKLYRNNGNGTFTDASRDAGLLAIPTAPGLGVLIFDLDGDGKQDIYVANDMNQAYLLHNKGGFRFEEIALRSGCALGPGGARMAGMGVEAADFDGSGRPSLFVTNFQDAPNVFFLNRGKMLFDELSYSAGLGGPSLSKLGFGTCALDANLDGHLDLAVANGHVHRVSREIFGVSYAQEAQLFLGDGKGKFRDVSANAGSDYTKPRVARGLARADFNNDGKADVAFSAVAGTTDLLQNTTTTANNWVTLHLIGDGKSVNRNAIGSTVTIEYAGHKQTHFLVGGGSYLSANEFRFHIGLATHNTIDKVTVKWTNANTQTFTNIKTNTRWKLVQNQPSATEVK